MPYKDPEKAKANARERARRYRERHPECVKQSKRKWRAENIEKDRAASRQWSRDNRDRMREVNRAYYWRNHEKVLALQKITSKRWRQSHPGSSTVGNHKRKARILLAGGTFSRKDIMKLHERQDGKCYWCKKLYGKIYHIDHVWPLKLGGSNGSENLVLACPTCNFRKNARTPMEFGGRLL